MPVVAIVYMCFIFIVMFHGTACHHKISVSSFVTRRLILWQVRKVTTTQDWPVSRWLSSLSRYFNLPTVKLIKTFGSFSIVTVSHLMKANVPTKNVCKIYCLQIVNITLLPVIACFWLSLMLCNIMWQDSGDVCQISNYKRAIKRFKYKNVS